MHLVPTAYDSNPNPPANYNNVLACTDMHITSFETLQDLVSEQMYQILLRYLSLEWILIVMMILSTFVSGKLVANFIIRHKLMKCGLSIAILVYSFSVFIAHALFSGSFSSALLVDPVFHINSLDDLTDPKAGFIQLAFKRYGAVRNILDNPKSEAEKRFARHVHQLGAETCYRDVDFEYIADILSFNQDRPLAILSNRETLTFLYRTYFKMNPVNVRQHVSTKAFVQSQHTLVGSFVKNPAAASRARFV